MAAPVCNIFDTLVSSYVVWDPVEHCGLNQRSSQARSRPKRQAIQRGVILSLESMPRQNSRQNSLISRYSSRTRFHNLSTERFVGINTSFVKIRVRPAEQTTLAGGNYYDLQLADGSMVRAFLEKPLWIPPTAETRGGT